MHCFAGMPVVLSGLKGVPHAGDALRVTASEGRARAVSEARAARSQAKHHARLDALSQEYYDTVVDEESGESKQCGAPASDIMR
jgi:hypothetical protein